MNGQIQMESRESLHRSLRHYYLNVNLKTNRNRNRKTARFEPLLLAQVFCPIEDTQAALIRRNKDPSGASEWRFKIARRCWEKNPPPRIRRLLHRFVERSVRQEHGLRTKCFHYGHLPDVVHSLSLCNFFSSTR